MARIRTIKPEFWTDGSIIRLPLEARLFYIGMWNFVCDRGHIEDDPLGLKLKILPADMVDGGEIIDTLVSAGRIERMDVDGRSFLNIPRFNDHQRIDTRWKSRCPACNHVNSMNLAETHVSSRETHGIGERSHVGGEGKGKERNGGEGKVPDGKPPTPNCRKHPNWNHSENCRPCGDDRRSFEAWEAAEDKKPRPPKPHVHKWMSDGTCNTCTERKEDE